MNMQAMLRQAQAMQKDMMKAKEEIDKNDFVGENGAVKVTMKGSKVITKVDNSIKIPIPNTASAAIKPFSSFPRSFIPRLSA